MALRQLQASLLAERERVLESLELRAYSGPLLAPVPPISQPAQKRKRGARGGREAESSLPQRRSSRVAGIAALDDGSNLDLDVLEIDQPRVVPKKRSKEPRRVHVERTIGVGESHVMLQLTKGISDKYYEITTAGSTCIMRNGRRGNAGVERIITCQDAAAAQKLFSEKEAAKRAKGYYDGTDGSEEGAKLVPLGRWTT